MIETEASQTPQCLILPGEETLSSGNTLTEGPLTWPAGSWAYCSKVKCAQWAEMAGQGPEEGTICIYHLLSFPQGHGCKILPQDLCNHSCFPVLLCVFAQESHAR